MCGLAYKCFQRGEQEKIQKGPEESRGEHFNCGAYGIIKAIWWLILVARNNGSVSEIADDWLGMEFSYAGALVCGDLLTLPFLTEKM